MTVIYSTTFTTGADADVEAFNTDFVRLQSATDIAQVLAANGYVTPKTLNGNDRAYRYTGTGSPTSDQKVTGDLFGGDSGSYAGLIARGSGTAGTYYYATINPTDGYQLWRYNSNVTTLLATGTGTVPISTWLTGCTFTVTGTGATVSLSFTVTGVGTVTFSDTSGSRLTSGHAGFAVFDGVATANAGVDTWSVDDLLTPGTTAPRGVGATLTAVHRASRW